ncbi:MAG TPA: cell division protein ZapA [Nitrospirae bacterium]|nr:cell division protein ZapA [bacterium BMS3Abin10]GBE38764.1 cell division protein ZapA [bacterium BMS3Bbin08]HDH51404.1 cell division protein ZapA [Nitrospirota bacterium]HDK16958.1 cell division protein ZapA [Nitrospirota bacterium]HDK81817.1 cell division protein ZapA [Nitrospirota bacterium]
MHSVEVQILGQTYSIRTDEDEAYIKALAEYVDQKLKEIYSAAPNVNHVKAAIMTALGIADEFFKARSGQEDLDRMIEEKTKMLSSLLE